MRRIGDAAERWEDRERLREDQWRKLAYIDPVTGASNLIKFRSDVLGLLKCETYSAGGAMVCLDLDKFKYINEIFGYEKGDAVLRGIAAILGGELGPGETFDREYTDHFFLLIRDGDEEAARERVEGIIDRIISAGLLQQEYYRIKVRCGIYCFHDSSYSPDVLMDRADLARQAAKADQKGGCVFYTEEMHRRAVLERELEQKMEPALLNSEFIPYIQPRFDLFQHKVVGGEALVRWIEGDGAIHSPGEYIPFFERNGFITKLDFAVFRQICRQIRMWLDRGLPVMPISVNVSRLHLNDPEFEKRYCQMAREWDIPGRLIELELTESIAYYDMKRLKAVIEELHDYGFLMSLDDFGSEYSSLNILKELPVDIVKLDRLFFTERQSERERIVIESCVEMCHRMGIKVVCEGVEQQEQVDFLRQIGCGLIQGYWFARPMPVEDYERLAFGEETGRR